MENQKIPLRVLCSYFGYGLGQSFSFVLVTSLLPYFYSNVIGISITTASTVFFFARMWDACNDLVFAGIIDSLKIKRSKYHPFLGFMPIIICSMTILAFINIEGSIIEKTFYAFITYILWETLYTLSNIPFLAITTELSNNPQERSKIITCAILSANIGIGLATIFLPYGLQLFAEGRQDQGYLPVVIILMIVSFILMRNGYWNTQKYVNPTKDVTPVYLSQPYKVVKNKPLFILLIIELMGIFANIASSMYVFFFYLNTETVSLLNDLGHITVYCSIACIIAPILTAKFHKKTILILLCLLEIIVRLGFYFSGYDTPTTMLVWLALINIIFVMTTPIILSMIADTVEYSYYHTGKRCVAMTFASHSCMTKVSIGLSSIIGGFLYICITEGVTPVPSLDITGSVFVCISVLPIIGAIIRIILLKDYSFNEEQHTELIEKLNRGEFDPKVKV